MKKKQAILIVDDNPENLAVLGSIVAENGYTPRFAPNGAMALVSVKKKRPDLILLDIMMPDMDGFEVCRRLKQDATLADIPIIFLTAKTEKDDVIAGLELGAVDYVTKPFNQKELTTRVNTHLEFQATKEELREALAAKEEALATKNKFFSIIAHDLANIFCGSIGLSNILSKQSEQNEASETDKLLGLIQHNLNKGYGLLRNLLDWSRSQTGKINVTPDILKIKTVVDQNISLLKNNATAKDIKLSSTVGSTLVFADEQMLNTIIRNLLSNAIKFTPVNGKIEVSSQEEGNMIEVSILDTGVGIKPQNIDKLFRIDVSHSTRGTAKEEGTGLGLILCKEFVEKNGGTIGVESEVEKGSRFYIRLPINH
ncbi:hybrid sensor histidine kinase/response regulator [Candidatus Parabeggiatoa sp. HSG14]|uniref:hybrid sensor histidine kinase/response regulator n=1 Tax=Candidatus Parabeggiatoa sp. HSG14 TaxID=3055593 RepID=UPI0025A86CB3|nr:hybrid sensor histidine kinase/response regulator [Thiotrichales bacterium HSG14]